MEDQTKRISLVVHRQAPIYPTRTAARLAGLSGRTLRAWEWQELITPARTSGGYRLFSEEGVERIREIKAMRDQGMGLKGIQRLLLSPLVLLSDDPDEEPIEIDPGLTMRVRRAAARAQMRVEAWVERAMTHYLDGDEVRI